MKKTSRYTVNQLVGERKTSWVVDGRTARNKRVRKRFPTEEAALGFRHRLEMADRKQELAFNTVATRLDQKEVDHLANQLDRLPGGVTLSEVIDRFLRDFNRAQHQKLSSEALGAYIEALEKETTSRGFRSPRTITERKNKVLAFLRDMGLQDGLVEEITRDQVQSWLESRGGRSWNDRRAALMAWLNYCRDQGWVARNVAEEIRRKNGPRPEVGIFTASEAEALLRAAYQEEGGRWLGWMATALFAGLRPDGEMGALTWEDIDLEDRLLYVRGGKKSVSGERYQREVEIHPTLEKWLRLALETGSEIFDPVNHRRSLGKVRMAAGFYPGVADIEETEQRRRKKAGITPLKLQAWPQDGTRHTCGTYLAGAGMNKSEIKDRLGTSEKMLRDHYLKVDKGVRREAKRFWALDPETVLNEKRLRVIA